MTTPGGPMDMSQDPDRYDPSRDGSTGDAAEHVGLTPVARPEGPRLDPGQDPDRYRPELDRGSGVRRDPVLSDLLGESAGDEPRDTYTWLAGLVGVLGFLALVALLFGRVLSAG